MIGVDISFAAIRETVERHEDDALASGMQTVGWC